MFNSRIRSDFLYIYLVSGKPLIARLLVFFCIIKYHTFSKDTLLLIF